MHFTLLYVPYCTRQALLYCTLLNCLGVHWTVLPYTTLHCTVLSYTALHYTDLHCHTLHWTELYCHTLHCSALYCCALHTVFTGGLPLQMPIGKVRRETDGQQAGPCKLWKRNSVTQKSSIALVRHFKMGILPDDIIPSNGLYPLNNFYSSGLIEL